MKKLRKKVLLIDLDEVIVERFVLKLLNEFKGTNYTKETFTKTYIQDELLPEEKQPFFDYILSRKNVYDDVALMDGAAEVMPLLNEKFDLYICSDFVMKDCEERSSKLLIDKCEILSKHFPFISSTQYIFMRNKKLLKADVIIDDRPGNFGPNVRKCLLFTQNHNKHLTTEELAEKRATRVDSWHDIKRLLLG